MILVPTVQGCSVILRPPLGCTIARPKSCRISRTDARTEDLNPHFCVPASTNRTGTSRILETAAPHPASHCAATAAGPPPVALRVRREGLTRARAGCELPLQLAGRACQRPRPVRGWRRCQPAGHQRKIRPASRSTVAARSIFPVTHAAEL